MTRTRIVAGHIWRCIWYFALWLWGRRAQLIAYTIGALIFWQIGLDYLRDSVVIDPIEIPAAFQQQGYTSEAFANEVRDEIDEIERSALAAQIKTRLVAESSRVNDGLFQVQSSIPSGGVPDIDIPETQLSFHAIVDFVEHLLGIQARHISGEVTILTHPSTSEPATSQLHEQVSITMRVTSMEKGDPRPFVVSAFSSSDNPKEVISRSAKSILQLIDPYTLAAYEYEVEKDENAAWYLTEQCYGTSAKQGRLLQGNILYDRDDLDGAIDKFREAAALDPRWAYPYKFWADVLLKKMDYDEAIVRYRRAIRRDRSYADAYDGWGLALIFKHDYDGAVEKFRDAIALNSRDVYAYTNWGMALAQEHDYDGAIVKYQQAIATDSHHAVAYSNWAWALIQKRQYDDAIAKCKQAIALDPRSMGAYNNWGIALASQRDYDGAIVKYQQAIAIDPKFVPAYINLASSLIQKRQYDDAIANCKRAIALDPRSADAYNYWGTDLDGQHDYDGAIVKYQQAIAIDPKFVPAYNNWGGALILKHDYDGARVKYLQALAIDPTFPPAKYNLQWLEALRATSH